MRHKEIIVIVQVFNKSMGYRYKMFIESYCLLYGHLGFGSNEGSNKSQIVIKEVICKLQSIHNCIHLIFWPKRKLWYFKSDIFKKFRCFKLNQNLKKTEKKAITQLNAGFNDSPNSFLLLVI